jgi:hypothetical protein
MKPGSRALNDPTALATDRSATRDDPSESPGGMYFHRFFHHRAGPRSAQPNGRSSRAQ